MLGKSTGDAFMPTLTCEVNWMKTGRPATMSTTTTTLWRSRLGDSAAAPGPSDARMRGSAP